MGKIFKFYGAVILSFVLASSNPGLAASSSEARDVQIIILGSDSAPMDSVSLEPVSLPQVPQTPNKDGLTTWKLSPTTHRFKVSVESKLSPWLRAAELQFSIPVQSEGISTFKVQLPKLVNVRIPITDGNSFGGNLIPIKWVSASGLQVVVNGQLESTNPSRNPNRLLIEEIAGEKFGILSFFESPKLARQNFSDKDGDLIPDSSIEIQTRFGPQRYMILSSMAETDPTPLSLSQVPYIRKAVNGSEIELSVFEGSTDVTNLFPAWNFLPLETGEGVAVGTFIKGQTAQLNYSFLPSGNKVMFSFRSNGLVLAEEYWNIPIVRTECISGRTGVVNTFSTLGECPSGWLILSEAMKLAEKTFSSCKSLNLSIAGGVARANAVNKGKRTSIAPLISSSAYQKNKHLDVDKDGIACER